MNSDIHRILAKSSLNGGTSLVQHIGHVLPVAETIARHLGLQDTVARHGAILHDIGKAHPAFQAKLLQSGRDELSEMTEIPLRHELSSLMFLPLFPAEEWGALTDMVVAHHKSIESLHPRERGRGIIDLVEAYGEERIFERHIEGWEDWSKSAVSILASFGIETKYISREDARGTFQWVLTYCEAKGTSWSKWRGVMVGADHFASALGEKSSCYVEKLFHVPDTSFFKDEGRNNPLYPLSMISADDKRPHTLVTAPTGAGKTDFLLRRCHGRIFYMLPFQASINAMYSRLKTAMPDDDVRVLHASSRVTIQKRNGVEVHEERTLQPLLGSSVKVLTPHQVASVVFATRGFEAIALDLTDADVILDEIHVYTDVARSMVLEIVKVLLSLRCRVHVGTATMPSVLRDKVEAVLGGPSQVYRVALPADILRTFDRHIVHKHERLDDALKVVADAVRSSEKILLIANRVKDAQERFDWVKQCFPNTPSMLLHSRFKRGDRAILEGRVREEFDSKEGPCIVVSTQVVEVSLDISFDRMITDCAPLDSLIQRFGRVNRRRSEKTIGKLQHVHVVVPPDDVRKAKPYDLELMQKSYAQLPDGKVLEEFTIQSSIDSVYPSLDLRPIDSHLAYTSGRFRVRELCHYPNSVLLDALEIEAGTCILQKDKAEFLGGRGEERMMYEIPIPWRTEYTLLKKYERLEVGSWPVVLPTSMYDPEKGLSVSPPFVSPDAH